MVFFLIAVLAGVLTILAPCILPLLPIVVGSSDGDTKRHISKRSLVVIGSLAVSVIVFTLLLKATTLFIVIPGTFWQWFSGVLMVLVGLALLFPQIWAKVPMINRLSNVSNKALGAGHTKNSYTGDMLVGASLGPVFTTCSPTYLFIIATILPAGFIVGLLYLLGFVLGLSVSLLLIAFFGNKLMSKITARMDTANKTKKVFAVIIIVIGIAIMTGYDKKLETAILDSGYGATINFEESLIDRFAPKTNNPFKQSGAVDVPMGLQRAFSNTDWSFVDPNIERTLSGGPGKDGIPSIDAPKFVLIDTFKHPDSIQAIVIKEGDTIKVYPYNILTWHEIVNDTINGVPVAVTFCPLCGSAIVYDRRVDGEVLTFGVSGFLLESNMIMFDREGESLWQQSTGRVLAGRDLDTELSLAPFQLMTMGEVKKKYPNSVVLSENTGYKRAYDRNPYSGYEDSEGYIFSPSKEDARYPSKTIFVVFRYKGNTIGTPYLELSGGIRFETSVKGDKITLERRGDILTITDSKGNELPFYFEMWFSFITQHGDEGIVINL
jgi:cytochrome c biogenesis protein CcdA